MFCLFVKCSKFNTGKTIPIVCFSYDKSCNSDVRICFQEDFGKQHVCLFLAYEQFDSANIFPVEHTPKLMFHGRNPAPLGMYKPLKKQWEFNYQPQLVQISSINSVTFPFWFIFVGRVELFQFCCCFLNKKPAQDNQPSSILPASTKKKTPVQALNLRCTDIGVWMWFGCFRTWWYPQIIQFLQGFH